MAKRKSRKAYKAIWEKHYNACLIPGLDMHHIDGNADNNSIDNLIPLTRREHFEVHLKQGDYGAAAILSRTLDIPDDLRHKIWVESGKRGGAESWRRKSGMFAMDKEVRREISRRVGKKTVELKIGIHRINANPELAAKNSSYGGKVSFAKRAGFHSKPFQKDSVGDTKWWIQLDSGKRKRSKRCPGKGWIRGMGKLKT